MTPGEGIGPRLKEKGNKFNDRLMLKRDTTTFVQFILGLFGFLPFSRRCWHPSDRKVVEKWALCLGINNAGQMLEILLYGKLVFFALLEILLCSRLICLILKHRHILRRFSHCPNWAQTYDTQMRQILRAIQAFKRLDLPEIELILQRGFAISKLREEVADAPI